MRRQPFDTALVGPSALLREGLARVLGTANFRVITSARQVQDLPASSKHQPVLLLIDSSNDSDQIVAQISLFKERYPSGRVAVLTDHYRPEEMVSAFRAGANLYFTKSVNCDAFIKALELVMLGETIVPLELLALIGHHEHVQESRALEGGVLNGRVEDNTTHREKLDDVSPPARVEDAARLSGREKCILQCIVGGDSNKKIARKFGIAEATVKVHVKAILRKIRVHNRTQAAIWAVNNSASICPPELSPAAEATWSPPRLPPPGDPIDSPELAPQPEQANGFEAAAIDGRPAAPRARIDLA
jgi:two-component system nitrate/nitrite response regulator NarL